MILKENNYCRFSDFWAACQGQDNFLFFSELTLCKLILIQIRRLLQDRSNLDKELIRTQQELTKVEGKLQNVVREKSTLATQVASLEKDLIDIKKSKEVLKTKV